MTYQKPSNFPYQIVLDSDGLIVPGADPSNPGEGNTTVDRIADQAYIETFTEQIVGKSTVLFHYLDTVNSYTLPGRWFTTTVPSSLLLDYRTVVSGTAEQSTVDMIAELIMLSPEGNAATSV